MFRSVDVLWTSGELTSAEHFRVSSSGPGAVLRGTVVILHDERPAHIRYEVVVDESWRTRSAMVDLSAERQRTIEIRCDDGTWRVDGVDRDDLLGCVDVDLGTRGLPIRRGATSPAPTTSRSTPRTTASSRDTAMTCGWPAR